jgi:segregation and condensation protein A
MPHTINTEKFQGPIGVLYEMIEARKLSVSDFSLVAITEDFVNHVKSLGQDNFSREEISQFITIASVLILLKSKSLIPELELTEEEDRDIAILENQLKAFELLKTQSKFVGKNWQRKGEIFSSGSVQHKETGNIFVPNPQMQISYFHKYIQERLSEIVPKEEEKKEVKVHKVLKIEDALSHVRQIISRLKNLNFKSLGGEGGFGDERLREKNKKNLVILFLAVLELVKIGEIDATQDNNFGDILVNENS